MVTRRRFMVTSAAAGSSLMVPTSAFAQADATPPAPGMEMSGMEPDESGHVSVDGLDMYYEVYGSGGVPLVMLHGAIANSELSRPMAQALAQNRQVIAVDQQVHGRTADVDRPLSYEQMADDTAALLETLGIEEADVFGYSMGAATALLIAVRHPALVRKLVVASPFFSKEGFHPEILEGIEFMSPEIFAGSPPEEVYRRIAPNPDDFPTLVAKVQQLEREFVGWPAEDIQTIEAPTLIIVADSDAVRLEHAVELFNLLGGGVPGDLAGLPPSQFAVIPATTHVGLVVERGEWLVMLMTPFLDAPMPEEG